MPEIARSDPLCFCPQSLFAQWQQRTDAENARLNRKFLARNCQPLSFSGEKNSIVSQWIFSHVPKTAGTTLENTLGKNVPLKDQLRINAPVLNAHPNCYGANGRHPHLVMGHHPLHGLLYQLLPENPLYHFSLLRQPVKRIISWYNYLRDRPDHALHPHVSGLSFDEFLDQQDLVELHNGQCRRLTGRLHENAEMDDQRLLEEACDVVTQCFSFIGTTERFTESLLLLQKALGLRDVFHQRHNRSRTVMTASSLSDQQRRRIVTMNQADMALYEWVDKKLSELSQQHLSADAISIFDKKNRQWQNLLY